MSLLETRIRQLFDLSGRPPTGRRAPAWWVRPMHPRPGTITYITGPSGGGKSQLLRSIRLASPSPWIEPADVRLPNLSVIEGVCQAISPSDPATALEQALAILARVGLSEAWTYLRKPARLSQGERWRLQLAMMLIRAGQVADDALPVVIAIDEFAAVLDRVTAATAARALRRAIDQFPGRSLAAVVVTSHDDLTRALDPELQLTCDFGKIDAQRPRRHLGRSLGEPLERCKDDDNQQHAANDQ